MPAPARQAPWRRTRSPPSSLYIVLAILAIAQALQIARATLEHGRDHAFNRPQPRQVPAFGTSHGGARLFARDIKDNGAQYANKSFDYVIVGGGLAGLTVANRLSEDSNITVLVIEAGGDIFGQDQIKFLTPSANLYDSAVGTGADWQWVTTPQKGLNGAQATWPRGKVLGGSSSINGLYMVRASQIEHNAWGDLNNARDQWGWDAMLAAMKKSETFHQPVSTLKQTVNVTFNAAAHGTNGPIQVGWPAVGYPAIQAFLDASVDTGTPLSNDPDNGQSWGTFVATSSIDPSDWQRSSSRTGYLNNTVNSRQNLRVLIRSQVTRVIFNKTEGQPVKAVGVEYASDSNSPRYTVNASREVILCGGAINSPQLLQLSGIGDAQQLQQVGVEPLVDLPGVGHNVQDHLSTAVAFTPTANAQMPPVAVTGNAQVDSYTNNAIAYVNVSKLFGNYAMQLLDELRSNLTQVIRSAPVRDEVKAAYNLTYSTQVNDVFASPVGPIEILFALTFGQIQVQVALQHPLSRGSILITSSDPFASPAIDAGYLSQDIDLMMLREGVKLAREIGTNAAMKSFVAGEQAPGAGTQTDDQFDEYVRSTGRTEYHPSSGCSMLPLASGGVVDPNLLVYGTANLRVIDSSVPPLAVSAHLMTITYGLAEIGADIIKKARTQNATSTKSVSTSPGTQTVVVVSSSSPAKKQNDGRFNSGATRISLAASLGCGALGVLSAIVLLL